MERVSACPAGGTTRRNASKLQVQNLSSYTCKSFLSNQLRVKENRFNNITCKLQVQVKLFFIELILRSSHLLLMLIDSHQLDYLFYHNYYEIINL